MASVSVSCAWCGRGIGGWRSGTTTLTTARRTCPRRTRSTSCGRWSACPTSTSTSMPPRRGPSTTCMPNFPRPVFCLGDAVHRHPPTNGLGSKRLSGCLQLGLEARPRDPRPGRPELLDTYYVERAPIAKQIVGRANKSLGYFPPILDALGLSNTCDPDQMNATWRPCRTRRPNGERRRTARSHQCSDYVYNSHGVEMNRRYTSSAIIPDGTPEPEWPSRSRALPPAEQSSRRPSAARVAESRRASGFDVGPLR